MFVSEVHPKMLTQVQYKKFAEPILGMQNSDTNVGFGGKTYLGENYD